MRILLYYVLIHDTVETLFQLYRLITVEGVENRIKVLLYILMDRLPTIILVFSLRGLL